MSDAFYNFLLRCIPAPRLLALGAPLALAWVFVCIRIAAHFKSRGMHTGYTRKIFHFLIFGSAAAAQMRWGLPGVCILGGAASLVVFHAVWRGDGFAHYEAMAREKDEPHRTHYILVPYLATLTGGLAANMLFGPCALAGYLVAGLGDAIAEPIGTRFGKHRYRVPTFRRIKSYRSLEGSAAVFVASLIALLVAAPLLKMDLHAAALLPRFVAVAAACTILEAVSPHGWDNLVLQVAPSWMVFKLIGGVL